MEQGSLNLQPGTWNDVKLKGVNAYRLVVETVKSGDRISLEREPLNAYDENAICVKNQAGQILGYIPAAVAVDFAQVLDALGVQRLDATVADVLRANVKESNTGILIRFQIPVQRAAKSGNPGVDFSRLSSKKVTDEQKAIILHPTGEHARVLAVAGSGKTETMVMRIKYLVENKHVNPESIQILMFNTSIRREFQERLNRPNDGVTGLANRVNNFHSIASIIRNEAAKAGLTSSSWDIWESDEEPGETSNREKYPRALRQAINQLEQQKEIAFGSVGQKEAEEAIGAWKNALIAPSDAGHKENPNLVKVYAAYEELRLERNGITFDDFVPMAVVLLKKHQSLRDKFSSGLRYVFVDEYQDVNYAQQRLIELLAGEHADVMVIGDDDQTLYEWRGARPDYILKKYQLQFPNKPVRTYHLTNSFRFGPLIAQCAENSVRLNTIREEKSVVANNFEMPAEIHVVYQGETEHKNANRWLKEQIMNLLTTNKARPTEIIVLCRMYAQLSMLEAEFIGNIPYRVEGQAAFFKRHEAAVFLDYLRVALEYHSPLTEETSKSFTKVINNPNRKIPKDLLKTVEKAAERGATLADTLQKITDDPYSGLRGSTQENFSDMMYCLESAHKRTQGDKPQTAGQIIEWIKDQVNYAGYLKNYYGKGDPSFERIEALDNFIQYAEETGMSAAQFVEHIKTLDTTLGESKDEQIVMTTVYQVKGKQYPYVIIPNCNEGYMPSRYELKNSIFDTSGRVQEAELSPGIENERRLFYVALTRATKAVFLGASLPEGESSAPSRFLKEIDLQDTKKGLAVIQSMITQKKGTLETLVDGLRGFTEKFALLKNFQKYIHVNLGMEQAKSLDDLVNAAFRKRPALSAVDSIKTSAVAPQSDVAAKKKWYED
ncbi:MAG: UvrD-helicase domain-containing protein [Chloroflexi bacterium]|nr:UvrD-helicase domain-containing protein [Chloroflexota bacterium]